MQFLNTLGTAGSLVLATIGVASPARAGDPQVLAGFDSALDAAYRTLMAKAAECHADPGSVHALMTAVGACTDTESRANDLRLRVSVMRRSRPSSLDEMRVLEMADEAATRTRELALRERLEKRRELPDVPLGLSNFALTMQLFVGLALYHPDTGGGRGKFSALDGAGGGVKLRYDYLGAGRRKELVGLSAGLFFEPSRELERPGVANVETRTLSALVMLSTFENIYFGVGYTFLSEAPVRGFAERSFLVFGLGIDGKALTPGE